MPLFLIIFADILYKFKNHGLSILKGFFKIDLAVIGVFVMGLVFILSNIRGNSFENPADLKRYLSKNQSKIEYSLNKGNKRDPFDITIFIEYCVTNFGKKHEYLIMHTPLTMIVNLIPRSMWYNKPVGFGLILAQYSHGYSRNMDDVIKAATRKTNKTSFAAGLTGEGYANGGTLGVVFLSFFIGWITGILGNMAKFAFLNNSIFVNVFGIVFFQASTSFVRGAMLDAWSGSVYPIVILILLIYFALNLKFLIYSVLKLKI